MLLRPIPEEGHEGIATVFIEFVIHLEAGVGEPHAADVAGGNVLVSHEKAGPAAENNPVADQQGGGAFA